MPRVNQVRYNGVAMTLHWLIAALIITNILIAWYFNTLNGAAKIPAGPAAQVDRHHRAAAQPGAARSGASSRRRRNCRGASSGWERMAAVYDLCIVLCDHDRHAADRLGAEFGQPADHAVYPIKLYGVIPWPAIGYLTHLPHDQMKSAHTTFVGLHGLGAKLAYALIVLHVLAAGRHWLILRDGVAGRMVPFLRAPAR